MKGQLGTQVKDASHSALGNRSPGAAGRAREGLRGPGSSERKGSRPRAVPGGDQRPGRAGAELREEEGRRKGGPAHPLHHLRARADAASSAHQPAAAGG